MAQHVPSTLIITLLLIINSLYINQIKYLDDVSGCHDILVDLSSGSILVGCAHAQSICVSVHMTSNEYNHSRTTLQLAIY